MSNGAIPTQDLEAVDAPAHEREQRAQPRRWRLQSGRIRATDGGFSLVCTIVDISDDGAKVRVDAAVNLPNSFFLVDCLRRVAYDAQLVWSAFPEYGLRFVSKSSF